jgi:hypothetical protein
MNQSFVATLQNQCYADKILGAIPCSNLKSATRISPFHIPSMREILTQEMLKKSSQNISL